MITKAMFEDMSTSPITNETSLKNRPNLRWTLIGVWIVIVLYTAMVLGTVLSPQFTSIQNSSVTQMILGLPALFQLVVDYGVDLLLMCGED